MNRRIAAILAADMVGFSRLVEADEADVLGRQKAHREALIDPVLARWNGRIVKTTGDGVIATFESVADAVRAAAEVQRGMAAREADVPEDRRIRYRVGVNLGDVVFDEGDVFGDGVNVAARLEGLAEPGGVVVSGTAHDVLKSVTEVGWKALGEVKVKNLSRPVRAFALVDVPAMAGRTVGERGPAWRRWAAAAAVLAAVAAGGAAWQAWRPDFGPADPAKMAYRLPEEPSIVVMPLRNLTNDSGQDGMAAGLTEALVNGLVSSPLLVVVTGHALVDGSASVKPGRLAETFGVRFVLDGSLQAAKDRLRVRVELADGIDGRVIWSETFEADASADGMFEIQDMIAERVAAEVDVELSSSEYTRAYLIGYSDLEDIRLSLKGENIFQTWSVAGNAEAERIFLELKKRLPKAPGVRAFLGWIEFQRGQLGLVDDPATAYRRAREYARESLEIDPSFAGAYAVLTHAAIFLGDFEAAERHAEAHLQLIGGTADQTIASAMMRLGRCDDAEPIFRRVLRVQPRHGDWVPLDLARCLMQMERYDEARVILEGIVASEGRAASIRRGSSVDLIALEMMAGDPKAAKAALERSAAIWPNANVATYMFYRGPHRDDAYNRKLAEALTAGGVPETPPPQ